MLRIPAAVAAAFVLSAVAPAQLRVVTTIPDLADLVTSIGGDAVQADSLTSGVEDLHFVRIRPSMVVAVRRADAFVQLGLDAEHAWVPALLRTARNDRVRPGADGFCNASAGIEPLGVPDRISRADGPDVHPRGNPHFNLDPRRMRIAAATVRDCLVRLDPQREARYDAGLACWQAELDERVEAWRAALAPFRGARFIESHDSWRYFADVFGLEIAARLEPKPGLAPTPGHLAEVVRIAEREGVGLIVGRPRFADVARHVAERTGAAVALLEIGSASEGPTRGWFAFMDHVVETFAAHLRGRNAEAVPAGADGADGGDGRDGGGSPPDRRRARPPRRSAPPRATPAVDVHGAAPAAGRVSRP